MRRLSAVLCVIAGLVYAATPELAGERVPVVHIRWADGITPADRVAAESSLRLAEAERLDARSLRYALIDSSPETVRAIVRHPAIADTHYIDRDRLTLPPDGPRSQRRYGIAHRIGLGVVVPYLEPASLGCLLAGVSLLVLTWGIPRLKRFPLRHVAGRAGACLMRGVPACSAEGAALFRIAFMLLLIPMFADYTLDLDRYAAPPYRPDGLLGDVPLTRWMLGAPGVVVWFERGLMLLMVAAAAGFGRPVLLLLIAGIGWWMVLRSHVSGHHPLAVVLMTLLCLIPARWNDALTVLPRARKALPRGPIYGYAVWVPTLVLGVACAAAAYAKLEHGPEWIANGTVRYHFLVDYPRAKVDWGLRIAASPLLAVALSAVAVIVEAGLITAVFVRRTWYRALAAVCGLAVFAGFYLFQGELWLGWWLLFLGFLPWHLAGRRQPQPAGAHPPALGRAYLWVVIAVVLQQIAASAFHVERPPLVSAYDMYATTYASPEDFDARTRERRYHVRLTGPDREEDATECVSRAGHLPTLVAAADARSGVNDTVADTIARCFPDAAFNRLELLADERGIDWVTGLLVERYTNSVLLALPLREGTEDDTPTEPTPYNR